MPLNFNNLIENLCPCCGRKLAEFKGRIYCIKCTFEIDKDRAERIKQAKIRGQQPHKRNRWQNLKENRCIREDCGSEIVPVIEDNYRIMKCTNKECDFKITIVSFNRILNNPNHCCNMIENKKGKVNEDDGAYRYERY